MELKYIIYNTATMKKLLTTGHGTKKTTTPTVNLNLDVTLPDYVSVEKVTIHPFKGVSTIIAQPLINGNALSVPDLDVDGQKKLVIVLIARVGACYIKYAETNKLMIDGRVSAVGSTSRCMHSFKTLKVGGR